LVHVYTDDGVTDRDGLSDTWMERAGGPLDVEWRFLSCADGLVLLLLVDPSLLLPPTPEQPPVARRQPVRYATYARELQGFLGVDFVAAASAFGKGCLPTATSASAR
jgi:hypothetical protein